MRALWVSLALLVAGCADSGDVTPVEDDFDDVEVDETTGGIRGVVVNEAIEPIVDAKVVLDPGAEAIETITDEEGRFFFSKVEPGTHFLSVSERRHETVQASVVVEAGVATPPVVRVQLTRLYSQDPYMTQEYFRGHFGCSYSIGLSTTCVNDYTRLNPTGHCPGGCFPWLASLIDNREYVTVLDPNWQTIQIEMMWDPSLAGTSDTMRFTVSYFDRPDAGHSWGGFSGTSPLVGRLDFSAVGGTEAQFNEKIPDTGLEDLFVFMASGNGQVSLEQEFEVFHHHSYYAPLPEDWSFLAGDDPPF